MSELAKEPVEKVVARWIAEWKCYAVVEEHHYIGANELLDRLDEAGYEIWSKSISDRELGERMTADRMADELDRLRREAS
jgi:hypothetical protein